jgi:hypothetical protein
VCWGWGDERDGSVRGLEEGRGRRVLGVGAGGLGVWGRGEGRRRGRGEEGRRRGMEKGLITLYRDLAAIAVTEGDVIKLDAAVRNCQLLRARLILNRRGLGG